MQIVIDIDENVFTRLFDNGTEDYEIVNDDLFTIAKSIRKGTPLNEVLDKIRAEIEAEMNDLYRQKSIDQRTLTIIHACQRHIAIIDEYTKAESDEQEKIDDYRDRLDELEREEYYESKYGKEQE